MDFGLTVREEGAYIFDCQVPGRAGLLGPLHVVSRQQDKVAAEHTDIRKKGANKENRGDVIGVYRTPGWRRFLGLRVL